MKTYSNDIVNTAQFDEINKIQTAQIENLQQTTKIHRYAIFALIILELVTFTLVIAHL